MTIPIAIAVSGLPYVPAPPASPANHQRSHPSSPVEEQRLVVPIRIQPKPALAVTREDNMAFLILVIGDIHIPDRALDIPPKVSTITPEPALPPRELSSRSGRRSS